MREPKLDSILAISAGGPKLVVFVIFGFETCGNVYLCVFYCASQIYKQSIQKIMGLLVRQGGGRNWNPYLPNSARGRRIFFLSYAGPTEGLERVVMNFILFYILTIHCTQIQKIKNFNFVFLVRH